MFKSFLVYFKIGLYTEKIILKKYEYFTLKKHFYDASFNCVTKKLNFFRSFVECNFQFLEFKAFCCRIFNS